MLEAVKNLIIKLDDQEAKNKRIADQTEGAWFRGYCIGKSDAYTFAVEQLQKIVDTEEV